MKPEHLEFLIDLVLTHMHPTVKYSQNAITLLMLTAAVETHLGEYIYQLNKGPAVGIFQMEPRTEMDLWEYILRKPKLASMMKNFGYDPPWVLPQRGLRSHTRAAGDLVYQIIMARIYYWRVREPLPGSNPVKGVWNLAEYWKQHWNTPAGKGTAGQAVRAYQKYVHGKGAS